MKLFTYDPVKDRVNQEKHGINLAIASRFDWETATFKPDMRKDYGEQRIIGTGYVGASLHVVVFVVRGGTYRIISLRKANEREGKRYEKETRIY